MHLLAHLLLLLLYLADTSLKQLTRKRHQPLHSVSVNSCKQRALISPNSSKTNDATSFDGNYIYQPTERLIQSHQEI